MFSKFHSYFDFFDNKFLFLCSLIPGLSWLWGAWNLKHSEVCGSSLQLHQQQQQQSFVQLETTIEKLVSVVKKRRLRQCVGVNWRKWNFKFSKQFWKCNKTSPYYYRYVKTVICTTLDDNQETCFNYQKEGYDNVSVSIEETEIFVVQDNSENAT